jgi:hypothetical protein
LLNRSFRREAREAFSDLAQDGSVTDPLHRVQVAQGLRRLGPESCLQALELLMAVMADNAAPPGVRGEAAKVAAPLCDNDEDARRIDSILIQWSRSASPPEVRLQAARTLALLYQLHQNNASALAQRLGWDQRAVNISSRLASLTNTSFNAMFSIQAVQILENMGQIDRLNELGDNPRLSYLVRSEAARALERLGQVYEAAGIWMDLAQQTDRVMVTPFQRVEAAVAAGQDDDENWRETKAILQGVAQSTCITEPLTCLEAAAALRQLGWYEEAISFVMVLDKNHRDRPELARAITRAMRWRDL